MKQQIPLIIWLTTLLASASFAGDYVGSGTIKSMQNAYGGWILGTNRLASNPDICDKNNIILEKMHSQYKEIIDVSQQSGHNDGN